MLDAAGVLIAQPMPPGTPPGKSMPPAGIAVIGNSDALAVLAANAADRARCAVRPVTFARDASVERYRAELRDALADAQVAAGLVVHVPAVESQHDAPVIEAVGAVATEAGKPIVAVMQGHGPMPVVVRGVPVFADVEDAVRALASMLALARWRQELADDPLPPPEVDADAIADLVESALRDGLRELAGDAALALLAAGGLQVALPEAGAGPSMRLSLACDAHFGPVAEIGLDDPVALALGDAIVRLAPLGQPGAMDAVGGLRALPAILPADAHASADAIDAYVDAVVRVSWMHAWCPFIERLTIRGLRYGYPWRASEVRVWLDPSPEDFDPQARRMGG